MSQRILVDITNLQHGGTEPRFWFTQSQNQNKFHNITNTYYDLKINTQSLGNSDNFVRDLKNIFDECFKFAVDVYNQTAPDPARKVRFVLTATDLLRSINLPFMPIDELTSERIFTVISNFAQSHRVIILGDNLYFHFQLLP